MEKQHSLQVSVVVTPLSPDREIDFFAALDEFVEAFVRDHVDRIRATEALEKARAEPRGGVANTPSV